jgi:hypothetical protein
VLAHINSAVDLAGHTWLARGDATYGSDTASGSGTAWSVYRRGGDMTEGSGCPYCGLPLPASQAAGPRELPAADADRRRIEELEREVRRLRETVARLRGGTRPLLAD